MWTQSFIAWHIMCFMRECKPVYRRLQRVVVTVSVQASTIAVQSMFMLVGFCFRACFFISAHTCSIGLMSGDRAGHTGTRISSDCTYFNVEVVHCLAEKVCGNVGREECYPWMGNVLPYALRIYNETLMFLTSQFHKESNEINSDEYEVIV
jgi:hypothetical protein